MADGFQCVHCGWQETEHDNRDIMDLDEKEINKTRDEMHTLLKEIYKDNLLIKDYFQSKYKIDTTKF